jgi:peptidoglycan hydrolase-like protein with peptidoglycan-binding domain
MKLRLIAAAAVLAPALLASPAFAATNLSMQLDQGMTNQDVTTLQTFLAEDTTIYPQGLVTGYFGPLTFAAVSNFQARNGLPTVGRVGPLTLAAINAQINSATAVNTIEGAGKAINVGSVQPVLSNITATPTANSAIISWNSNVAATARVMYSAQYPFNYNTVPSVTSNAGLSTNQSVTLTNLQSNTTYYFVAESLDPTGNFSWSYNGATFKTTQ